MESLQNWLSKLQRDSSTDDEEMLDEGSRAYLHSFRDNFTRYSLFQVSCLLKLAGFTAWHGTRLPSVDVPADACICRFSAISEAAMVHAMSRFTAQHHELMRMCYAEGAWRGGWELTKGERSCSAQEISTPCIPHGLNMTRMSSCLAGHIGLLMLAFLLHARKRQSCHLELGG